MDAHPDHATKADLLELRNELRRDFATKSDLQSVRDELRGEMHAMRDELRGEMHAMRDELRADLGGQICDLGGQIRGVGAMVERMQSDIRAMVEGFGDFARKSDLRAVDERVTARITLLEDAIREVASSQRQGSEDIRLLRNEMAELRLR